MQVYHTICWQDWRQQRSMLLLDIVSTTSLNLPLEVPTLSEAIQNVFSCGVSWIDDLVGPHLKSATLLITGIFTSFNTRSLLRTAMFYEWSKILQPDVLPNTNTVQNQHSEKLVLFLNILRRLDTIKDTSFTIHICKQTIFFLWIAFQRLCRPLPSP